MSGDHLPAPMTVEFVVDGELAVRVLDLAQAALDKAIAVQAGAGALLSRAEEVLLDYLSCEIECAADLVETDQDFTVDWRDMAVSRSQKAELDGLTKLVFKIDDFLASMGIDTVMTRPAPICPTWFADYLAHHRAVLGEPS